MAFVSDEKRTNYCGELNSKHVGEQVTLMGWVDTRRDHGGLVFVDLRDREGLVQVVLNPQHEATMAAREFRNEYVVAVEGVVRARPEGMVNKKLRTGEVEVEATRCAVLSKAEPPPIQISDDKVTETMRLKYRYLDLRAPRLQKFLRARHQVTMTTRNHLASEGFLEIETPILYKSTPEGARDYLVPSRVTQGAFYALPQSPQTLKQLLMISGFDKYFQIARCFRDEDLRADRQPEFSQIDIEMSFVDQEDVIRANEKLLKKIWKEVKGSEINEIPRMSYTEALNRFGIDRPDLRNPLELRDLTELVTHCGFKVFEDTAARGGSIKALALPGGGKFSRKQFDNMTETAKSFGAKGLVWIKADENFKFSSPVAKFFEETTLKKIFETAGGQSGDAVIIVADDFKIACGALGHLRNQMGRELGLIDETQDRFVWILDFPLLEYDPDNRRWAACHHPFTMPQDSDIHLLESGKDSDLAQVKAKAYDLVCNGYELAGGSIRIHRKDIQSAMFKALGLSDEEVAHKFGFFIEALGYGTPPHGGIAWGVDRLLMILCHTEAIRDVIAFPKTTKATDLMASAPSEVATDQLLELGIRLR